MRVRNGVPKKRMRQTSVNYERNSGNNKRRREKFKRGKKIKN